MAKFVISTQSAPSSSGSSSPPSPSGSSGASGGGSSKFSTGSTKDSRGGKFSVGSTKDSRGEKTKFSITNPSASQKSTGGKNGRNDAVGKAGGAIDATDNKGRTAHSYLRDAAMGRHNANSGKVTAENFDSKLQQALSQYNGYFDTFQNTFGERQDLTEDDRRRMQRAGFSTLNNGEFGNGLEDWKTYGEGQERQIKAQTAELRKFMDDNADLLNADAASEIRSVLDQMDDYSGQLWRAAYNDEGLQARDAYKRTGIAYSAAEKAYNEAQAKLREAIANERSQNAMSNTPASKEATDAVEQAREEARAAEEALQKARAAYETAGGLGHSYSDTDRVASTVKGAVKDYGASLVGVGRVAAEFGAAKSPEAQQNALRQYSQDVDTAQRAYDAALQANGGDTSAEQVILAKRDLDTALSAFNAQTGRVTGEAEALQGFANKAQGTYDRLAGASAMDISRAKNGASDLTRFLVDAGVAGTQMLGDAAIGAATFGALSPKTMMAIRVFGKSAQEAKEGGGDIDQQILYGGGAALLEVATESMFDGLAGLYGAGGADEVVEKVIGRLAKNPAVRNAMRLGFGAAGEAAEEAISGVVSPALRTIYTGNSLKEEYSKEKAEDVLYDALVGGFLGLSGGGVGIANGQYAQANAQIDLNNAMNQAGVSTRSQAQNAMDVLSGRATPEQMAQRESAARATLAENMGGTDALSQYINNQRLGNYQNVQAAQTTTATQALARRAVAEVLAQGRVNNTTVNEILNDPELRAAAEYQTGLSFEGMTTEQARTELQRAARRGAYTTSQFNAQEARAAEAENARAQAALEEEAARNNANNYDSYIRGVLKTGADTQTANEILNDENLIRVWERLAQKPLPRDKSGEIVRKSALKMLRETTRANVDINVDSAIEQYIAERNAPTQTAPEAAETQGTPTGEITQPAPQTDATAGAVELNSNPTPAVEAQTAETVTAPTAEAPAETAQAATPAPAPAPTAQAQTGDVTLTPTDTTTAESTNGTGDVRERGGSANTRTNENAEQPLRQSFENVPDTYRQLTNKETQAAADEILAKGFDSALAEVTEAIGRAKAGMKLSPAQFVAGFQVANELIRRGNVQQAREIMSDLIAEQTAAGQLGQVGRLVRQAISDSDPATRMMAMQKLIGKLNQQLTKGQTRTNVVRGVGSETGAIQVSEQLLADYANAKPGEEQQAAYDAIKKEIAAQIPPTFTDKFTALRYLNMLGNFKTQVRNLLGNTTMMLATNIKYTTQASIEALASALSGGKYQRNTSLFTNRDLLRQANDVFTENADDISGEGKYSDSSKQMSKDIRDEQRIFGTAVAPEWTGAIGRGAANAYNKTIGTALEKYRLATKWAMESGDTLFMRPVFNRAYAGWMKAHGVTDISTATAEQKASAYEFAKKEAQEATFHDSNVVSDAAARFGRGENTPRWWSALCEGVIPFRKTPANVGVRAFEYSPLGVTKVIYDAFNVKNGKKSGADVINDLSKTMTGTTLFAAGMLLKAMGHARASGAEDDDELNYFQKQQGVMDYSININGTTVSLSNLAPMSIPFFMGVKLQEYREESGMPSSMQEIGEIASVLAEPMLEMSMLSGVNDFFNNLASVGEGNSSIMSLVGNAALGYLSQGLTNTLLGQFEQANEENRQSTYVDRKSSDATALDQFLSSADQKKLASYGAKTPVVDYHQEDYVDAWGRTQSNGGALERYFNALLNPFNVSRNRSEEVDAELERLHSDNLGVEGFPEVLPQKRGRSEVIGDGIVMTPDEYRRFSIESGQTKLGLVSDFMNSSQYQGMSDAERAKTIQDLYTFAEEQALQKVRSGYGIEKKSQWETEASLSNPAEYLAAKAVLRADEPDYSHMDDVFRNWGSYSSDTQDALKNLSGVNNMRFAFDELGMSTEEYNKVKSDVAKYEAEGLEGETKGAADAAVISKHYKGTDAEKLAALESQNLPDKQTGKRAAIVRRFEAAQERGVPFDTWAQIEGYVQDHAANPSSPTNKVLYAAASEYGYPAWYGKYIWRKDSSNEDYVTVWNDYFSQDYTPKEKADYGSYFETDSTPAPAQTDNSQFVNSVLSYMLNRK